MNSSANQSSESSRPPDKSLSDRPKLPVRPVKPPTESNPISDSEPTSHEEEELNLDRSEPIPPPSHPRQYRAIGLIEGQYQRSEEQITRGTLVTSDGTEIEAVLLGRTISLVKNHLDLDKPHLWVVYPRTRQQDDCLHVQIVGVWEPETLNKDKATAAEETPAANTQNGYFSIRGEVVYYAQDREAVIIKIRQSPRRQDEKPKFFKLKLFGTLPDRPVGRFWDFQIQLQTDRLTIADATDLGQLFKKKRPFDKKPRRGGRPEGGERSFNRGSGSPRPQKGKPSEANPAAERRSPLPKPSQKKDS
jgi:hypothetical protein